MVDYKPLIDEEIKKLAEDIYQKNGKSIKISEIIEFCIKDSIDKME